MALNLTVKKQKGGQEVDVTYWEIIEFYAKPVERFFTCELRGFRNKQAYNDYLSTGAATDEYRFRFSLSGPDYPDTTQKDWLDLFVEGYITTQSKYGIDWTKAEKETKTKP